MAFIDFVLCALALQGFIIAGLLFYSSKTIVSNRWLSALVFAVSDWVLNIELNRMGIYTSKASWYLLVPHFTFAVGPIVYFYTKSLIGAPRKNKSKTWLHFLPLIIDFERQLIFLITSSGLLNIPFFQNLYFNSTTQYILFDARTSWLLLISGVGYAGTSYLTIMRHEKRGELSTNKLKDLKWLKAIIYVMFVCIGLVIYGWHRPKVGQYTMLLPLVAAVYVLGMAAWRRQAQMSVEEKEEYAHKPAKMYFIQGEADRYTECLTELMTKQQLYLNPVLKVDDVAAELLISEKTLSSLINQHLGKNFNDFVNEYRIAEVKLKLADPRSQHFTIAALAFDCGFNSLATFQRVFKQFTGTTPSKFQNSVITRQLPLK